MAAYMIVDLDVEALKRWWTSEDYGPLKPLRQRVSKANVIVVDGV